MNALIFQEFKPATPKQDPLTQAFDTGRVEGYTAGTQEAQRIYEADIASLKAQADHALEQQQEAYRQHLGRLSTAIEKLTEHLGANQIATEIKEAIDHALTSDEAKPKISIETSQDIKELLHAHAQHSGQIDFKPAQTAFSILTINDAACAFNRELLEEHIRQILHSALPTGARQ